MYVGYYVGRLRIVVLVIEFFDFVSDLEIVYFSNKDVYYMFTNVRF